MAKNVYIELAFSTLNLDRFNKAWDDVIVRYPTLSENTEPYTAQHFDLREYTSAKIKQVQLALRKKLETTSLDKKTWFSIITTQHDDITCIHLGIVPNLLTSQEIYHLLREWQVLYENPTLSLEPVELNTDDTETVFLSKPLHRYYEHFLGKLDHKTFAELRANGEKEHTSLSLALASVFRDELDKQEKHLPIYLTLANRFPLFPHMYDRASFATSINLFPLKFDEQGTFAKRCQTLEANLRQASLSFKPEMSKTISLKNKTSFALFTCTLDQDLPHAPISVAPPHILYSNIDLPLLAVELQAWQYAGQLFYRWSYLTEHSEKEMIPSTEISVFTPEKNAFVVSMNVQDDLSTQSQLVATEQKKPSGIKIGAALTVIAAAAAGTIASANSAQNAALNLNNNNALPPLQMPVATQNNAGLMPVRNNPNNIMGNVASASVTPVSTATPAISDSLKNTFGNLSKSIAQLASSAGAWAAQKATASSNTSTVDQQAYQDHLNQLPPNSPAVEFANTLDSLKDADVIPASINDIPPLDISDLDTKDQINDAANAYKEKVKRLHQPKPAPDLNQGFANMTGGVGANLPKVQNQLSNLGGSIDSFQQSGAGLDSVTQAHADLVSTMVNEKITGVSSDAPLVGASADISNAAGNVTDLASAQALQNKIDAFAPQFSQTQSGLPQGDAPLIGDVSDKLNTANNSPDLLALQAKTTALQSSLDDVQSMTCANISANKEAASAKVATLETSTSALAPTMPVNPIDKNLDDLTASTDQLNALPPDISADDPRFKNVMGNLQSQTEDLSANVSPGCPICRGPSKPAMSKPSIPNAQLPSVTNPLNAPSLNLNSALTSLNGFQSSDPATNNVVDQCKGSLSGLLAQGSGSNPMANAGDLSDLTKSSASNSPYKNLQDTLNNGTSSLKSKVDSLQSCPAFTDASNGPSLSDRLTAVDGQLNSMKDGLNSSMSGSATGQIQKLGNVRQSLSGATSKFTAPDVKGQVGDQLNNVSAVSGCLEALKGANPSRGGPQTLLVSGFKLKCNFGSVEAVVNIAKVGVGVSGQEAIKIPTDLVPGKDPNCGMCSSLMNPQVAAATAAAMGTLTPQPCLKVIAALMGAQKSKAYGTMVGTKEGTVFLCPFGGELTVTDPGQDGTTVV